MFRTVLALCLALLAAAPVAAQDSVLSLFDEGSFAFDYEQWPFGSYGGVFSAEGALLDTLIWGTDQLESCGGRHEVIADTTIAWAYGAVYNQDATMDVAACFVRAVGDITPGSYPVDTTDFMAAFAFFDDVESYDIPQDGGDIPDWLATVVAAYKFVSFSGSVTVSQLDEETFIGGFSGLALDIQGATIIDVSNGSFSLTGGPVATGVAPAPAPAIAHGSYPNPFNPKTRIAFTLAEAAPVTVTVHDASGRRLATPLDGFREAGEQHLDWRAEDARGNALPGGIYLYRIVAGDRAVAGKMLLLP